MCKSCFAINCKASWSRRRWSSRRFQMSWVEPRALELCCNVQVQSSAHNARNFSRCDSILIGDEARSNTYPYIEVHVWSFLEMGVFFGCAFLTRIHGSNWGSDTDLTLEHLGIWFHFCKFMDFPGRQFVCEAQNDFFGFFCNFFSSMQRKASRKKVLLAIFIKP